MARQVQCDICRQPTDEIVGKMFLAPFGTKGKASTAPTSNYTHHLDVGSCCSVRVKGMFRWTPRKTAKEYATSRRKNGVKST